MEDTDDVLGGFAFTDDRIDNNKIAMYEQKQNVNKTLWEAHKKVLTPVFFVGIVIASAILVLFILYISKFQERRKREQQAGMFWFVAVS